eukprot:587540-Pleurochrysis_carterae.AAC.1
MAPSTRMSDSSASTSSSPLCARGASWRPSRTGPHRRACSSHAPADEKGALTTLRRRNASC